MFRVLKIYFLINMLNYFNIKLLIVMLLFVSSYRLMHFKNLWVTHYYIQQNNQYLVENGVLCIKIAENVLVSKFIELIAKRAV